MGRVTLFRAVGFVSLALLAVFAAACQGTGARDADGDGSDLTVYAASSLTEAFRAIGAAFEAENPGTGVAFNFAGSATLRAQLEQGAHADAFASADEQQMERAVASGVVARGTPVVFATNQLVVVTPGFGSGVLELADLTKPGTKIVIASPQVPIGAYAREVLAKIAGSASAGESGAAYANAVLANIVSEENNVREVLAKVVLGEADAGFVYTTDARSHLRAEQVRIVAIPDDLNVRARYFIAPVENEHDREIARRFLEYLFSPAARAILRDFGFGPSEDALG